MISQPKLLMMNFFKSLSIVLILLVSLLSESMHDFHLNISNQNTYEEYIVIEDYSHGHVHYHYIAKIEIENSLIPVDSDTPCQGDKRDLAEHHVHMPQLYREPSTSIPADNFFLIKERIPVLSDGKPLSAEESFFRPPIV
jgi:hypothetical protein